VTCGRVGELVATLKHLDTGTTITLMDRPGYPPISGLCTGSNIDGSFDDEATNTAEDNCSSTSTPALSGTFQPDGNLSDFDLESLNGDWELTISDTRSGSYTGTLDSWCLTASGPTADSGERGSVASETGGKAGVLAAVLPYRPYANLVLTSAEWLAMRFLDRGSALRAARNAVILVREGLLATGSPPSGEVWRSYYYAGGQRVAMREQDGTALTDEVYYLFGDHLGSTSVIADSSGNKVSEMRFKPWGELRYSWFDPGTLEGIPTDFTFTGQRDFSSGFGLMDYGARFYDAALGRFVQADTIIPGMGNPGSFDRYAYVLSNPLKYVDPSGHGACNGPLQVPECGSLDDEGDFPPTMGLIDLPGAVGDYQVSYDFGRDLSRILCK